MTSPQALLLGSGITVLGTLRVLGRNGIVCSHAGGSQHLIGRSKWYHAAAALETGSLADYLEEHIAPGTVLIPCSDEWVSRVAALSSEVRRRFPASVGDIEVMSRFVDKGTFARLLEQERVPHPRTYVVDEAFDLAGIPRPDRLFIKPRDSQTFVKAFGAKAIFPKSPSEIRTHLDAVRARDIDVVLQEYVPGPSSNHYFVDGFIDRHGVAKGRLVRRRWRMHPYPFGNSSYMETVPPSEAAQAVEDIERLLTSVGYRGVYSAEFKRDDEDGAFKLLEVNARPWWFVEFAAACGFDAVMMSYLDAQELPVPASLEYAVGRRLVHPYHDVQACWKAWRKGDLGLGAWMRSWIGADQPVQSLRDFRPGLGEMSRVVRGVAKRRFSRGRKTGRGTP